MQLSRSTSQFYDLTCLFKISTVHQNHEGGASVQQVGLGPPVGKHNGTDSLVQAQEGFHLGLAVLPVQSLFISPCLMELDGKSSL